VLRVLLDQTDVQLTAAAINTAHTSKVILPSPIMTTSHLADCAG